MSSDSHELHEKSGIFFLMKPVTSVDPSTTCTLAHVNVNSCQQITVESTTCGPIAGCKTITRRFKCEKEVKEEFALLSRFNF
jgi:hypothetical protein